MGESLDIRCASCGWSSPQFDSEFGLADECAQHFVSCPRRYFGHKAFGFIPRWQRLHYPSRIEIAWTTDSWGLPFNLDEVSL